MLRSFLFVPGDSERKLAKGHLAGADSLILDLEDSVAADRKETARRTVLDYLKAADRANGPKLYVRVNAFDTGLTLGDLAAVMQGRPDGVVQPKCVGAPDIDKLGLYLDAFEAREGIAAGATRILTVATESGAATLALAAMPPKNARLVGHSWGGEDLSADLGASSKYKAPGVFDPAFELARAMCLMASAAAGIGAYDSVYPDLRDLKGLEAESRDAKRMGFVGKVAIHPDQVPVIAKVFTPGEEEVAWAKKIKAAFAANPSSGVINVDGQMIDQPHLKLARRILGD